MSDRFGTDKAKSHQAAKVGYKQFYMCGFEGTVNKSFSEKRIRRLLGQAVKTSPFHGGNTGSIPVGVIKKILAYFLNMCV